MEILEEKEIERGKETFIKGVVSSFLNPFIGFVFFLFFASVFSVCAQNMQIVFPKTAFTGDTLEIKYVFRSETEIVPESAFKSSPKFELRTDYETFARAADDFYVKEIFLERLGLDYTLTLKIVPWKAGNIAIPTFDLVSLARFSFSPEDFAENAQSAQNEQSAQKTLLISLKPVLVNSAAEKAGAADFRPQASPKTMPGTFAYLALSAVFYLALISFLVFALLNIPAAAGIFRKANYFLSLKRNSRKTAKKLKNLLKSSAEIQEDKDFAEKIQHILRGFLSKRFARDFFPVPTGEIYSVFLDLMGGGLSENQENAVESLIEIFFRTDFIRYSPAQEFSGNERKKLTQKAISLLALFDLEEGL